jgi:hypothetical protein
LRRFDDALVDKAESLSPPSCQCGVYAVRDVVSAHRTPQGDWLLEVTWLGFGDAEKTVERFDDVAGCCPRDRLLSYIDKLPGAEERRELRTRLHECPWKSMLR